MFVYNSEGEVDNITRFQALGGVGAWELVDATNAAAGAEQHVSGDLINPVQIQKGVKNVIVDPLLALDSLTLFLPANPVEGHELNIFFGGNIVSGTVVTAITISALPGYAILQSTEPTLILSGETLRYKHYEGAWYRV